MTLDQIDARYGPVVARCRSAREPNKFYDVRRHPTSGAYSCNCKSWAISPAACKECKHTRASAMTEGQSGTVDIQQQGAQLVQRALQVQERRIAQSMNRKIERSIRREGAARMQQEAARLAGRTQTQAPAADAIRASAQRYAAKLLMWGSQPTPERCASIIEDAIREWLKGSQVQAAAIERDAANQTRTAAGERGVRMIILSD